MKAKRDAQTWMAPAAKVLCPTTPTRYSSSLASAAGLQAGLLSEMAAGSWLGPLAEPEHCRGVFKPHPDITEISSSSFSQS